MFPNTLNNADSRPSIRAAMFSKQEVYMTSLDIIKTKIQNLYKTNPNIRINVSMTNPKVEFTNECVTIKGVYPHIFRIEECSSGSPKCHTLQYTDILTKHIEVLELN